MLGVPRSIVISPFLMTMDAGPVDARLVICNMYNQVLVASMLLVLCLIDLFHRHTDDGSQPLPVLVQQYSRYKC